MQFAHLAVFPVDGKKIGSVTLLLISPAVAGPVEHIVADEAILERIALGFRHCAVIIAFHRLAPIRESLRRNTQ